MNIRLDHFFILTATGAPIADKMLTMGLKEAAARDHPGQGTSNRRFNLANSTIEWLYVRDSDEASHGPARELDLLQRTINRDSSRLGLIVRANPGATEPPFEGWNYQPDYFPKDWTFRVGNNSSKAQEPLCICMPRKLPESANDPVDNPNWRLTQLQITLPIAEPSDVLSLFAELPEVHVQTGGAHAIAVEMNHRKSGQRLILEQDPPVTLYW